MEPSVTKVAKIVRASRSRLVVRTNFFTSRQRLEKSIQKKVLTKKVTEIVNFLAIAARQVPTCAPRGLRLWEEEYCKARERFAPSPGWMAMPRMMMRMKTTMRLKT